MDASLTVGFLVADADFNIVLQQHVGLLSYAAF
jgi:hypothetical protein